MERHKDLVKLCTLNDVHSSTLLKYSQVLLDYYDATYLHFDYTTYDGMIWALTTKPDKMRSYMLDFDGYKNDPVVKDARLLQSNIIVWTNKKSEDDNLNDPVNDGQSVTNEDERGITFVYFEDEGNYALSFSTSMSNLNMINMMIKDTRIIKGFKDYLLIELKDVISELEKNTFNLKEYVGSSFNQPIDIFYNKPLEEKIKVLIATKQVEEKDLELLNIYLPRRSKQCAQLYLKKNTIKEIAVILGVSMDTIRRYMFELKERFSVSGKPELLKTLAKLEKLDYFVGGDFSGLG